MEPRPTQGSENGVADVLGRIRRKGVSLWSKDGRLHYKAPKGVLTKEDVESLKLSSAQIVALLERADGAGPIQEGVRTDGPRRVPMTFSQLSHWLWFNLGERHNLRQVASATRLCGPLDVDVVKRSLLEVTHRHDALRTRIVIQDGALMQEIATSVQCELVLQDLSHVPATLREIEVHRHIEDFVLEPVDVAEGPLWGVKLLRLAEQEHVLIVAMEHIISDWTSLNILISELLLAYGQILKRGIVDLAQISIPFSDYALRQQRTHDAWMSRNADYWRAHLAGTQRVRFPAQGSSSVAQVGWDHVTVTIGRELKTELRDWCRRHKTTLVMTALSIYIAFSLRWCGANEMVIQYLTDGRIDPKLASTIGAFAFSLPLRVTLLEGDRLTDLVTRVTGEYCDAYDHCDFAYMESRVPRPEFVRNTAFNWLPQRVTDHSITRLEDTALTFSPVPFEHPLLRQLDRDCEPVVLLFDTEDEVICDVQYPANRFSREAMQRFGQDFIGMLGHAVRHQEERLTELPFT